MQIYGRCIPISAGEFTVAVDEALSDSGSRSIDDIFGFGSQSDVLVVLDAAVLDREVIPVYRFTVKATDSEGRNSTANVTITITDVNDVVPAITNPGYAYSKELLIGYYIHTLWYMYAWLSAVTHPCQSCCLHAVVRL